MNSAQFPDVLIELRMSHISGVGVFAATDIPKGRKVADGITRQDYKRIVSWDTYKDLNKTIRDKIKNFCVGTPEGFIPPEDNDFNKLSVEWYFNHSCVGNLRFDEAGDFIAKKAIKIGNECTYDYALAESNPRFRMKCTCRSPGCRHIITGDDWRKLSFREKNLEYMLPSLRLLSQVDRSSREAD